MCRKSLILISQECVYADRWDCRDEQIHEQIAVLNCDYASTNISWNLVNVTRVHNADWFTNVWPGSYVSPPPILTVSLKLTLIYACSLGHKKTTSNRPTTAAPPPLSTSSPPTSTPPTAPSATPPSPQRTCAPRSKTVC